MPTTTPAAIPALLEEEPEVCESLVVESVDAATLLAMTVVASTVFTDPPTVTVWTWTIVACIVLLGAEVDDGVAMVDELVASSTEAEVATDEVYVDIELADVEVETDAVDADDVLELLYTAELLPELPSMATSLAYPVSLIVHVVAPPPIRGYLLVRKPQQD